MTPRQELERVLDSIRAHAVIEHRQRIGKPLTAYAAKLLANQFAQTSNPNIAADEMIARGWRGFKAEWCGMQKTRETPTNLNYMNEDERDAYIQRKKEELGLK